jgi:hypothetical protein
MSVNEAGRYICDPSSAVEGENFNAALVWVLKSSEDKFAGGGSKSLTPLEVQS